MTLPVKEFASVDEMYASAKAVNLRMFPPRPRWVSYTPVEPVTAAAVQAPPPSTVRVDQYVKPTYRIPSIAHLTPKQVELLAKRCDEHRKKRGTGLVRALKASDGFNGLGVIKVRELVLLVEDITGIRTNEILSDQRLGATVKARQIVMWLALRFTLRSSTDIGRHIGNRDHTTVLHAVAKLNAVIAKIGRPAEDSPEAWVRHLWQADWKGNDRKKNTAAPAPLGGYWNIVVAPSWGYGV
jgi:hypothetical protein